MIELFHRSMNQVLKSSMPMGQDRKKQGPRGEGKAIKMAENPAFPDRLPLLPRNQAEGSDNKRD